jgi:ATP-dependent DNA helicase RecQ
VCGSKPEWLQDAPEPAVASPLAAAESRKVHRKKMLDVLPADNELRAKLREWRRVLAKELSVPAYVVLHDSTIDALCRQMPSTVSELMDVQGIGEKKAERFGAAILDVIRG